MADYNVQMKQFNGTSFDNILPYASQALTLAGGGGATEIIAQARAGLSQIATGSYVGTGTYSEGTTVTINLGFKPKLLIVFNPPVSTWSISPNRQYPVFGHSLYSTYFYDSAPSNGVYLYQDGEMFGVWYEGLTTMPIYGPTRGYSPAGVEAIFTVTDTSISWETRKPNDAESYGYGDYGSYIPEYIWNKNRTYRYIAFG